MTWLAEVPLVWIVDGRRVPGRLAVAMPELVEDEDEHGEGRATCTIALDGLQPRTTVNGEGKFHALLMGFNFIGARLRDHVSKGARAVLSERDEDPEGDTAALLAMFKPLDD